MKVVIAGAGFGGLRLARKLNNKKGIEVLLIDRFNYHQFQPLFYQVATAGLDASNISFPLRKVFQKSRNVRIRMAQIKSVDTVGNKLITDKEEIAYDILVLALGAGTNFFGNNSIATNAFPMKSTAEALQIRHRLLQLFEDAHTLTDQRELRRVMNIAIVGGGPTGVELAGAFAEMKKYVLPKDFPELDFDKMNIYLVEGTGKTLAAMSEKSSAQSMKYLKRLGVKILTNSLVEDYDGKEVKLRGGKIIPTSTLIWAAGIKGNIPEGVDKTLITRGNRIKINGCCQVDGIPNIYAIGDLAYLETEAFPNGLPQVAPVAIQQAGFLSKLLSKIALGTKNNNQKTFKYRDKGAMATVGRNLAVVDIPKPKLHFGGFLAWMVWMGLHLMLILGVKNRFFVFSNWVYNYLTYDQNLRLIFKEFNRDRKL